MILQKSNLFELLADDASALGIELELPLGLQHHLLLLLPLLVVILLTLWLVLGFFVHYSSPLPGPPHDSYFPSLLGSAKELIMEHDGKLSSLIASLHERYGTVVGFYLGPFEYHVSVADPHLIHKAWLNTPFRPYQVKRFLPFLSGNHFPFGSDIHTIMEQKSVLVSVFHDPETISRVYDIALKTFEEVFAKRSSPQQEIDVVHDTRCLAKKIAGLLLFGPYWLENPLADTIMDLVSTCLHRVPIYQKFPFPQPWDRGYREFVHDLQQIRPKVKALFQQAQLDIDNHLVVPSVTSSVLEALFHPNYKDSLDQEQKMDVLLAATFGGVDDAGGQLAWALMTMANFPHVIEGIRKELLENDNAPLKDNHDYKAIQNLEYLDAVYKEQQRYYMLGPLTPHRASQPFSLGTYQIPKNCAVWGAQHVLSRSEALNGPRTDQFEPFRWYSSREQHPKGGNDGTSKIRAKIRAPLYAGSGHRACVGRQVSVAILKAIYIAIAKQPNMNVEFSSHQDRSSWTPEPVGFILLPIPSPSVKVIRRKTISDQNE